MNSALPARVFTVHLYDDGGRPVISRLDRRIAANADVMKAAKVFAGDAIALLDDTERTTSDELSEHSYFAVGIAWPSKDVPQDSILVSAPLLLASRVPENGKARLVPLSTPKPSLGLPSIRDIQEAAVVCLQEVAIDPSPSKAPSPGLSKRRDWISILAKESLVNLKYVTSTQTIELPWEGKQRRFAVYRIERSATPKDAAAANLTHQLDQLSLSDAKPRLWTVGWDTTVVIDQPGDTSISNTAVIDAQSTIAPTDPYTSVGGLTKEIDQIRDLIEIPLTRPDLFTHFGLKPPKGILLHGPPGTGKTHLARAIAAATRASVLVINGPELSSAYHGETESRLRDVFREARKKSPCIVVLDEVDALCPRREDGPGGEVEKRVVATLLTIMDGMDAREEGGDGWRVVVVATTNRPNAIDPALRRPGRFDREIEIGIPDVPARLSILNVILAQTPHVLTPDDLQHIASRTHGYVGADLSAVVREAGTLAIKRSLPSISSAKAAEEGSLKLTFPDMISALSSVRPSAMREVFIETPQVLWTDIGGQAYVQQKLRECVEWPLLHPEAFTRLGVPAPKGVLLYGPPGCSKTLTAKALATESGINFIAVKGPELLNKYVGESERAVREIFRKARAAAPSIVFFDEIDALGTSRTDGRAGGAHEGVLTSLLNEMDGVQELVGVTVLAATNRPDVIDSALMRPGRLDRILYVGPPDLSGRKEILQIRTGKMAVDPTLDIEELASLTSGCSGAEIAAMCQDAALLTMQEDINAPFVTKQAFLSAARSVRRQITPDVLARFQHWRENSGLTSA